MKKKFSRKWKASKQARKQRKYLFNIPLHLRHKQLSANLSKELRKKYGKRNLPLRKGDTVKIMKGDFKGKKAKIVRVDVSQLRIFLDGIQRTKKDGTKINVPFKASNLQIAELNLDDKKRINALGRKGKEKIEKKQNSGKGGIKKE